MILNVVIDERHLSTVKSVFHFVWTDIETQSKDHHPKWTELDHSLIRDIFDTHKVFMFGSFNCYQYKPEEFRKDIEKTEKKLFGGAICPRKLLPDEKDRKNTIFPSLLIQDDLFQICAHFFAVSDGVNRLLSSNILKTNQSVFCCVIPEKVVSLYDHEASYQYSLGNVVQWLKKKSMKLLGRKVLKNEQRNKFKLAKVIEKHYAKLTDGNSKMMVILIDRRLISKKQCEVFWVFICQNIDEVGELQNDHFISMLFMSQPPSDEADQRVVRTWLHYGYEQRLRFWPEQLIWFIPRLFVSATRGRYQFAKKLFDAQYKHGFCVNLDDNIFNRYYKMLTSWTHQSVNYRRSEGSDEKSGSLCFGFRDYVEKRLIDQNVHKLMAFWRENGYSSDDIMDDVSGNGESVKSKISGESNIAAFLSKDANMYTKIHHLVEEYKAEPDAICTIDNVQELWHCHFVKEMIDSLKRFENENFEIDVGNIGEFNHSAIIRGLDHLTRVHDLFSIGAKQHIRAYFEGRVSCKLGGECQAMQHHCSKRREDDDKGADGGQADKVDTLLSVTRGALCSAHCYLLHSNETLYRISGRDAKFEVNPFSTAVFEEENEEKKEDDVAASSTAPSSMDFGVHVLQWLSFDVLPRFKSFQEEMLKNPDSTVTASLWEEYIIFCATKLKGKEWAEANIDELLCLKLYSDCTVLQHLFRKAYWQRASLETKRAFYQWGLMMYKTFLFHAKPIPKQTGKAGTQTLYHGLNRMFQVNDTAPRYQGPFSTTTSIDVAHTFANEQGLVFSMKGSYSNPIEFIIGISMVSLSCFKHEAETLLYSQTLPIKKTETFAETDEAEVDHLMHSIKSTEKVIVDKDEFYKKIGLQLKSSWYPRIAAHPILMDTTGYQGKSVVQRLMGDLRMKWLASGHFKCIDFIRSMAFNGTRLYLKKTIRLPHWTFIVSVDGQSVTKQYKFEHSLSFGIPVIAPSLNLSTAGSTITVSVKQSSRARSTEWVDIWEKSYHELFARYKIQGNKPLSIDNVLTVSPFQSDTLCGGYIDIQCSADMFIENDSGIDASGCGMTEGHYAVLEETVDSMIGLKMGTLLEGKGSASGRGGGIILLRSTGNFSNCGFLRSNGSPMNSYRGGTICIVTDGDVVNEGTIECKPSGRILIQCRKFLNSGLITPKPMIMIGSGGGTKCVQILSPRTLEIDRLIFILKEVPVFITNVDDFYERIGLTFDHVWIPMNANRSDLMNATKYKGNPVHQRLVQELKMSSLALLFCKEAIVSDEGRIYLEESDIPSWVKAAVPHCAFTFTSGDGKNQSKEIITGKFDIDKSIIGSVLKYYNRCTVTLSCNLVDAPSFCVVPIKSMVISRNKVVMDESVNIGDVVDVVPFDESVDGCGTFTICSSSDIIIGAEGVCSANGAGLRTSDEVQCYSDYLKLRAERRTAHMLLFGGSNECKGTDDWSSRTGSSRGAGGGIIALSSCSEIVNDGVLSSNGSVEADCSGGSIYICADSVVTNRGQITCKQNGRIIVQCRQFVNEGAISPEPEVFISDGTEQRVMEMVLMPWSRCGGKEQEIPLTVYRHRGHIKIDTCADYHPRNLSDKKGTKTRYIGNTPAVGDWITFKIESQFIVIPKAVIILNYLGDYGLKSISLSLSVDGDEFEDFAVIKYIDNWDNKEHYPAGKRLRHEVSSGSPSIYMN